MQVEEGIISVNQYLKQGLGARYREPQRFLEYAAKRNSAHDGLTGRDESGL